MKGGAVIVGSLLWDSNENRRIWREEDLDLEKRFQVYLPIRYGRFSRSRKNTYTMVFSNKCYSKNYGLGKGWIIPIVAEVNSFRDLKNEARKMGEVEGFLDGLASDWGSVALQFNPYKKIEGALGKKWSNFMSNGLSDHQLLNTKLKTEKSAIDSNGFLTMRWPQEVSPSGKVDDLDFIIATVTKPTLYDGRYPTVYRIAGSMNKTGYFDYFLSNMKNGIVTFQDERILNRVYLPTAK